MKIWMLSFCYVPMIISAIRTPAEEFRWAAPVYAHAALAMLIAMLMLFLLAREPKKPSRAAVVAPQKVDDLVPFMQMQWQGNN